MGRETMVTGRMALLGLGVAGLVAPPPASGQHTAEFGEILAEVESEREAFVVEAVADGFGLPFGLDFLPDGRLLVTDRPRRSLEILDVEDGSRIPVSGLPEIDEDGGIRDVALHPEYEENGWIYVSYSRLDSEGVSTAVARGRLRGQRLVEVERVLLQRPAVPDNADHLAGRIVVRDGYLFLTMGDRYSLRHDAQGLDSHHGAILRVHDDGRIPQDNPFVGVPGALPEIWSYGHRNPQGLGIHPESGRLWSNEHGPRGGDEINVIHPGRNYGWPVVSYGEEYASEGGGPIGDGIRTHPGMEEPVLHWTPSIGPSDLVFYRGEAFPGWRRSLFTGAMALRHLNRVEVVEGRVIHEERLLEGLDWRVRAIAQSPEGWLYLGIDEGMIVRLRPPS